MKRKGTSQNREELIKGIQMLTGRVPEYCSGMDGNTPFACKIGDYTVLWNGDLETRKGADSTRLLNRLSAVGLLHDKDEGHTLRIFLYGLSEQTTETILHMLTAKKYLLSKAIPGFQFSKQDMIFPLSKRTPEERKAYQDLTKNLINTAKKRKWFQQKRICPEKNELPRSDKYTLRIWLNQLGMKGKEYAVTRKILAQNLTGNTVYPDEKKLQAYNKKRKELYTRKNNIDTLQSENFHNQKGTNEKTTDNHNSSQYNFFIPL